MILPASLLLSLTGSALSTQAVPPCATGAIAQAHKLLAFHRFIYYRMKDQSMLMGQEILEQAKP